MRPIAVPILLLGVAGQVSAQETQIQAKETAIWQAVKDENVKAFESALDPEFVSVYPGGVQHRQDEVANVPKIVLKRFTLSDWKTTRASPDVVIVTYKVECECGTHERDFSGTYRASSTWRRRAGRWASVFHTEFPVEGPTAAEASSGSEEAARKEINAIIDRWWSAQTERDTAFFLQHVAKDFRASGSRGTVFGLKDALEDMRDTTFKSKWSGDEDRQIRIYGNGTVAAVQGKAHFEFLRTPLNTVPPGRYWGRYTEVFVKQNGTWQAVAGQYSRFPDTTGAKK